MTFTPGSDEGRTDTYEAQKKLQEDDQTAEEQFDEAQQGLRDANTFFQRFLGIIGALQQSGEDIVESIVESIGKDNTIVTPEQPIIEDVPQYPVVLQRILKVKKDNPGFFSNIVNSIGKDNTEEEEADDGTEEQIMQAYRESTSELDLDPFRGKTPEETSRKDIGPILSPESDLYLFEKTGRKNINRIKSNFTEQEIRLLKSFENHHAVPLKQSGWLVYGLPQNELERTQFYMAQRGLKGGNVLEQIRIYPEGIHDQAHELGERIIGQMRKRQGRSIEKILGNLSPEEYFALDTFESRKEYIDKFLDGITEIDNKINKVLDALYANRLNDETALDGLIDINANIEDPKSLGILDKLLEQIDTDPFIQKPLDDTANVQRAEQVRKEDKQLQGTLNRYLRAVVERNRQKFSKYDTFDDALDAAEQLLEQQGGGQRKLFYTSDGGEEYVPFAEQAERLARLLFENQ